MMVNDDTTTSYPAEPFYKKTGLRFSCRRCSSCCRYSPGYVFLSIKDIRDLEEILGLSLPELAVRYLRVVRIGGFFRVSLKERDNFDCILWEDGGCLVYPKRPFQCRSFPFWSSLLASRDAWEAHARECPGIGSGRRYTCQEIEAWQQVRLDERLIELVPENGTAGLQELIRLLTEKEL